MKVNKTVSQKVITHGYVNKKKVKGGRRSNETKRINKSELTKQKCQTKDAPSTEKPNSKRINMLNE